MVEKKMMLAGLKRQTTLLDQLILEIERTTSVSADLYVYGRRTELVASNLRKLRKIKQSYEIQDAA